MFIAHVRLKLIFSVIISAFILAMSIYFTAKYTSVFSDLLPRSATWVSRIDSFFDGSQNDMTHKDFQQVQALVAIQNGDITGVGPGKSIQKGILP